MGKWTTEEVEFLKENANILSVNEIATKLNRSYNSVAMARKRYVPELLKSANNWTDEDHEKFLNNLKEKNYEMWKELEFLDKFKGQAVKLKAMSPIGLVELIPSNLLKGQKYFAGSLVNKEEYYLKKFKEKHGSLYEYLDLFYENRRLKVHAKCNKHGIFELNANKHIDGRICPECSKELKALESRRTHEEFIELLKIKNPIILKDFEFLEEYFKHESKILAKSKYGNIYLTPRDLLCGKYPTIMVAEDKNLYFTNMAKEVHGDLYDYSKVKYVNARIKVCIICPIHGEFMTRPDEHINKNRGCPYCEKSKGESRICEILDNRKIKYIREKTFEGCFDNRLLRFDFYIKDNNVLIEYDGEFHYNDIFGGLEGQKRRDEIKNKYCKENNIKLIRIPYWEFDRIEEILEENLI